VPSLNLPMAAVADIFQMAAICTLKRYISVNPRHTAFVLVLWAVEFRKSISENVKLYYMHIYYVAAIFEDGDQF
jgi:hypothetical protein